ncbi:pyridoxamine 5'-phosphate oxidase family protein [Pyxidicoccus xibeiensis]|uniref:pyridoxamine 5'-phosphate oxidase family protein n=1 Tax=Pyxidicoccus xibeiensis TaxID=2906759 RepID=UPI0020A76A71|nr:pyridoxamine 5'-phosphate oxidase family protein [Pyxidicoccus xibeiensis]MCP3143455.1 pyridoxamine 5'-phosphate oxidase family protein [Pyxidicoccus xibeiensis]
MENPFHRGELAVQAHEGTVREAERVGRSIGSVFPPAARDFLRAQRMVVVASRVPDTGQVWASLLTGEPGFASVRDEHTLVVLAEPVEGDPLQAVLREEADVGLLGIELATRRRMKARGRAEPGPDGGFLLWPRSVYSLCPKYIQARAVEPPPEPRPTPRAEAVYSGTALTETQQQWLARADTFFIATHTQEGGADASHRGGNPGFVRVRDAHALEFPDYAGNNMFNTLGNLALDARAGLLFIDFEAGGTLQLTGTARATWEPERLARHAGAKRVVDFQVEEVHELRGVTSLRWRFLDYSRFNPR